jgi:hypothetical protein
LSEIGQEGGLTAMDFNKLIKTTMDLAISERMFQLAKKLSALEFLVRRLNQATTPEQIKKIMSCIVIESEKLLNVE